MLSGIFSGHSILLKLYFLYRSLLLSPVHTLSLVFHVHGGIRHTVDGESRRGKL